MIDALDHLLNIDTIHFGQMVHRIYPAELQLNKANASDTDAVFLDMSLSIHNYKVSTKYLINGILLIFRSLMTMSLSVPLVVYISLLIHFARAVSESLCKQNIIFFLL